MWACGTYWKTRNAYMVLLGKPEGKRPLGRLRYKWEDNIGMGHKEVGWRGMDWIDLAQDMNRWWDLASAVMTLGSIQCWEFLD
jgi:hypothetical protein